MKKRKRQKRTIISRKKYNDLVEELYQTKKLLASMLIENNNELRIKDATYDSIEPPWYIGMRKEEDGATVFFKNESPPKQ